MKILFLDQNKWIDLARVHSGKVISGPLHDTYRYLSASLHNGQIIIPLTVANIIETSKRHDLASRSDVVYTQAEFSKGWVFRSRKSRLLVEIKSALRLAFGYDPISLPLNWVVVPNFIRAFEEYESSMVAMADYIDKRFGAKQAYLDFMLNQNDQTRREAYSIFSRESDSLLNRIEKRRKDFENHSKEMQRRAYSAHLFSDHQELIVQALTNLGHTLQEMEKLGPDVFVNFLENIPTLNVELKLAISREAQTGSLKANDLGDVGNFYTSVPYANIIVAEKNFVNLAKQTKLDKEYGVKLHTNLEDLPSLC
jgi:hypothetical protein